ncbi:MAG: Do family serine endopeptidase, partial [Pseudomonadota bacterium]
MALLVDAYAQQDRDTVSDMSQERRSTPQTMGDVKASFAPLVDVAAPAVVNIFTKGKVSRTSGDPFFDMFFGVRPQEQRSLGSGVIVSPDGLIVTNNHVIEGMSEIKVVFADRREFSADVLLTDPKTDLAVLRIDAGEPLPFLEFANSDAAEVGDLVIAIGNPFGVGQTVTSGIISALARTRVISSRTSGEDGNNFQFFIQTDAAINPGNSGGALVDIEGKLLGVNTAIFSRSGGSNGVGFAVPSTLVRQVIATASNGGSVIRPWVGAATSTVDPSMASALGLDRPAGAIVNEVYPKSSLDAAGLKPGDVIVKLGDDEIFDAETLRYRFAVQDEGSSEALIYRRGGDERRAQVTFELAPDTPKPDVTSLKGTHPMSGVEVANMSPRFNEENGFDALASGVVVTSVPRRSFARRRGLRSGYRIISVNKRAVSDVDGLERALSRRVSEWN